MKTTMILIARTKEKPKDAYLKKQIPSGRMRKSVLPLNSNPF